MVRILVTEVTIILVMAKECKMRRALLLPIVLVMVSVIMLAAPATAFGASAEMGHSMDIPAGYRTVGVNFDGIDNVMMDGSNLSFRINVAVDVNDVIALIDDQLAYGGSVEESCTTRMRWVPGSTSIVGADGGSLNLQSTLAVATRACEPTMSMYTTSQHVVDYTISVSGSGIDDLDVSLDVNSVAGLPEGSSLSAARLDQIADANIDPVAGWVKGVAKAFQIGCLATADVQLNPFTFSADGSATAGVVPSGDLASMAQCVVLPSELSDLVTGTQVLPLVLNDLQPATVASIVTGAMMGEMMSVDGYISMVADDLADDTWRAMVVEALRVEAIQAVVVGGMGDMVPAQMAERLFSDAALEQVWGGVLLQDISADSLEALVLAMATGSGDVNALAGDLIGQIQPATIALALARLLTLG